MTVTKALGPEGWGPSRNAQLCVCGHAKTTHSPHRRRQDGAKWFGACRRTDCQGCTGYQRAEAAA